MNIAVSGSRDFKDYKTLEKILDDLLQYFDDITLISGGAVGVDSLAEQYFDEKKSKKIIFKPDWNKYNKAAGFIRNTIIIENSDLVIAFWDYKSRGRKDSIVKAKGKSLNVTVYNILTKEISNYF